MEDDQVATDSPAPRNGNGAVGLRIGDKSLSVQSQNLVLLVFIIAVGVLAWERGRATSAHVDRLHASIAHLAELIQAGQTRIETALRDQNSQLDAQTAIITKGMHETRLFTVEQIRLAQERTAQQTETIRQYLLRHEHNADLPREQRLPMDIPLVPPLLDKPKP